MTLLLLSTAAVYRGAWLMSGKRSIEYLCCWGDDDDDDDNEMM
jgi:hypothetical protein